MVSYGIVKSKKIIASPIPGSKPDKEAKICKVNITFYLPYLFKCKVYITFTSVNQHTCIMRTNYLSAPSYKKYGMLLSIVFACGCLYSLFCNQDDLLGALLDKAGKAGKWFDEL